MDTAPIFFPLKSNLVVRLVLYFTVAFFTALLYVSAGLYSAAIIFGTFVLVSLFKFREGYEIGEKGIRYRQGIVRAWTIPLSSILRAAPCEVPASFALPRSQGVKIDVKGPSKILAVSDAADFLNQIAARAPHLRRYDQELRSPYADSA